MTPSHDRSSDTNEPDDSDGRPTSGIARILSFHSSGVVLFGSPMRSSRFGLTGDRGTVGGVPVVDVVDDPAGQLHVLEHSRLLVHDFFTLRVQVDVERRMGVARANSLSVLIADALLRLRVPIESIEVVDARAWITLGGPVKEDWLRKSLMQTTAQGARLIPADPSEPHVKTLAQLGQFTVHVFDGWIDLTLNDRRWAP